MSGRATRIVAFFGLALLARAPVWSAAASGVSPAAPALPQASALAFERDAARCLSHARVDACYDAVRRKPGDPALLVALADALTRARRPEDALRNYLRAAQLSPSSSGLTAKISAAQAAVQAKRMRGRVGDHAVAAATKRFSNAAPEAQSH